MKLLKDIIYGIRIVEIKGNTNIAVESIAFDSRKINNLSLFNWRRSLKHLTQAVNPQ